MKAGKRYAIWVSITSLFKETGVLAGQSKFPYNFLITLQLVTMVDY